MIATDREQPGWHRAPDKRRVRIGGAGAGPLSPRHSPRVFLGAALKWSGGERRQPAL